MRTREEQAIDMAVAIEGFEKPSELLVKLMREELNEAERRGYERARTECAADTRRIDTIEKLISETVSVEFVGHFNKPDTSLSTLSGVRIDGETGILPNIRATIDAAMEGGK